MGDRAGLRRRVPDVVQQRVPGAAHEAGGEARERPEPDRDGRVRALAMAGFISASLGSAAVAVVGYTCIAVLDLSPTYQAMIAACVATTAIQIFALLGSNVLEGLGRVRTAALGTLVGNGVMVLVLLFVIARDGGMQLGDFCSRPSRAQRWRCW